MIVNGRGRCGSEVGDGGDGVVGVVSGGRCRCGGEGEQGEQWRHDGAKVGGRLPEAVLVVLEGLLECVEDSAAELKVGVGCGKVFEGLGDMLDDVAGVACDDGLRLS